MATGMNDPAPAAEGEEEEWEEITIDVTEDNMVMVRATGWELTLSPDEARGLAQALNDAAEDAEMPVE